MAAVEAPGGNGEIEGVQGDCEDLDWAFTIHMYWFGRLAQLGDLRCSHDALGLERWDGGAGGHTCGVGVLPFVEVSFAWPGGEEKQDPRGLERLHAAGLAGREGDERACVAFHPLVSDDQAKPPGDDLDDGVLVQPVVAQLVAGIQVDENGAPLGPGEEHPWLALPIRVDRREVPALHGVHASTVLAA